MTREYLFAGFGGQGLLFSGKVLAYKALIEEKHVSWFLTSQELNVRDAAGMAAAVIYTSEPNQLLEMTGKEEKDADDNLWYEVITPTAKTGWCNSRDGVSRSDIVYVTPSGKRYHELATCAGKNAIPMLLENAQEKYTPCQTCVE